MFRGISLFKCTECGRRFFAPDIELKCSSLSTPQRCPKCGGMHTRPSRLFGGSDKAYKKIWENMEKNDSK